MVSAPWQVVGHEALEPRRGVCPQNTRPSQCCSVASITWALPGVSGLWLLSVYCEFCVNTNFRRFWKFPLKQFYICVSTKTGKVRGKCCVWGSQKKEESQVVGPASPYHTQVPLGPKLLPRLLQPALHLQRGPVSNAWPSSRPSGPVTPVPAPTSGRGGPRGASPGVSSVAPGTLFPGTQRTCCSSGSGPRPAVACAVPESCLHQR